jgi:hypothetical protein
MQKNHEIQLLQADLSTLCAKLPLLPGAIGSESQNKNATANEREFHRPCRQAKLWNEPI